MLPKKEKEMIIVVFSSRNETLYFAQAIRSRGFFCQIVNTPREAGQACGISVKLSQTFLQSAKEILASKPFRAFVGVFRINSVGQRTSLEKLI